MKYLRHPYAGCMIRQLLCCVRFVPMEWTMTQLRDFANFAAIYEGEEAFLRIVSRIKDSTIGCSDAI